MALIDDFKRVQAEGGADRLKPEFRADYDRALEMGLLDEPQGKKERSLAGTLVEGAANVIPQAKRLGAGLKTLATTPLNEIGPAIGSAVSDVFTQTNPRTDATRQALGGGVMGELASGGIISDVVNNAYDIVAGPYIDKNTALPDKQQIYETVATSPLTPAADFIAPGLLKGGAAVANKAAGLIRGGTKTGNALGDIGKFHAQSQTPEMMQQVANGLDNPIIADVVGGSKNSLLGQTVKQTSGEKFSPSLLGIADRGKGLADEAKGIVANAIGDGNKANSSLLDIESAQKAIGKRYPELNDIDVTLTPEQVKWFSKNKKVKEAWRKVKDLANYRNKDIKDPFKPVAKADMDSMAKIYGKEAAEDVADAEKVVTMTAGQLNDTERVIGDMIKDNMDDFGKVKDTSLNSALNDLKDQFSKARRDVDLSGKSSELREAFREQAALKDALNGAEKFATDSLDKVKSEMSRLVKNKKQLELYRQGVAKSILTKMEKAASEGVSYGNFLKLDDMANKIDTVFSDAASNEIKRAIEQRFTKHSVSKVAKSAIESKPGSMSAQKFADSVGADDPGLLGTHGQVARWGMGMKAKLTGALPKAQKRADNILEAMALPATNENIRRMGKQAYSKQLIPSHVTKTGGKVVRAGSLLSPNRNKRK